MGKQKILVVDDEIDFIEMIKIRLEAKNYEVISVTDARDALDKIKVHKPDAILLDILMPGINGLELLRTIRQENKNLPVFILTAFADEKRFEKAKSLDASGFIVKTRDLDKEIDTISSALSLSSKYKAKE